MQLVVVRETGHTSFPIVSSLLPSGRGSSAVDSVSCETADEKLPFLLPSFWSARGNISTVFIQIS